MVKKLNCIVNEAPPTKEQTYDRHVQKYIVASRGEELVYVAETHDGSGEKLLHKHVAQGAGIERREVLGGGSVRISDKTLDFYGESTDFGPVPQRFFEVYGDQLLDCYREFSSELERIIHPEDEFIHPIMKEHMNKRWESSGWGGE